MIESVGTDTEGDSCFSINQTGGFCVWMSNFFVHLTRISSSVTVSKLAANLKISLEVVILGYTVSDEPIRAREKCYPSVWLIVINNYSTNARWIWEVRLSAIITSYLAGVSGIIVLSNTNHWINISRVFVSTDSSFRPVWGNLFRDKIFSFRIWANYRIKDLYHE